MVQVTLLPYIKRQILDQVEFVVEKQQGPLPLMPEEAPMGVGDEAFSILFPPEFEKTVRDVMPSWNLELMNSMYVNVITPVDSSGFRKGTINRVQRRANSMVARFNEPHMAMYGRGEIRNVKGIELAIWDGSTLTINPATDGSTIDLPNLRDFVANVQDIAAKREAHFATINKARNDMDTFLSNHRTLQAAVKKFGPALFEFVPPHIKEAYDRKPQPRDKKPASETLPQEAIDSLIVHAAANRLQLDA